MAFKEKISTAAKVLAIPALSLYLSSCKPKSEPIQPDKQITSTELTVHNFRPVRMGEFVKGKYIQDTAKLPDSLCFTLDSLGPNAFNPKDSLSMPYIKVSQNGQMLYRGPTSSDVLVAFESKNGTEYHCQAVGTDQSEPMLLKGSQVIGQMATIKVIWDVQTQ